MFAPGATPRLPGHGGAEVGEDVAEQVGRQDHVDARRVGDHARGQGVHVVLPPLDRRVILRDLFDDFVPQHHRMLQRVGLGRAGELASRALGCHLERVARDALDAVAREDARLLGHLVRRADVHAPAEPGVLPFGVLAHADHVDICRRPVRERRGDTGQEPHRPQVDVLLEALAQRQDQLPDRDVIGHARVANRAEIDRLELLRAARTRPRPSSGRCGGRTRSPKGTPSSAGCCGAARSMTSSAAGTLPDRSRHPE